jgi:hypothetical protein
MLFPSHTSSRRPFPHAAVFALSLTFAALAGCRASGDPVAQAPDQTDRMATDQATLRDSGTLDPSDVLRRSTLTGCQLIPYAAARDACVAQNEGLHGADACGAMACAKSDGRAVNEQRQRAWGNCYARRSAIYDAFTSTVSRIDAFKSGNPQYKGWEKRYKDGLTLLVNNIKQGQPGHKIARDNANKTLKYCNSVV